MRTPRFLAALLLALTALVVGACGGDDEGGGSSSEDVNELLTQTFTGDKQMDSGKLALAFTLEAQGEGAEELQGPVKVTLDGPFDASDKDSMPKFALKASFEGAGQSLSAGATSTGDKGYVSFQGTDYVVADQVFQQFKTQYEQARQQAEGQDQGQSLATLGLDPRKWLVDPQNAGEAQVGDTDTVKITAGIDVNKLLDDANTALEAASALGAAQGQQIPEKLTEEQKRQAVEAIKDPKIEIYTGKDDKILRRLVLSLGLEDEGSSGTIAFDVSITDLNEDQEIPEPQDAQPFDQLLGQLGGLGALGGAGAGSGSGSGSGGGQSDGGGAAGAGDFEAYSECLTKAGDHVQKARDCADLLAP
ncbi:MAG: hypothetical protein ABWZ67_01770 [Solirubrobacteraceae bacterium]